MVTPLGWDNNFRFLSGVWMFIDIIILIFNFKNMTEDIAICTPQIIFLYLLFMFVIGCITIVPVSSPLAELSPFYDITGDEMDLPSFVDSNLDEKESDTEFEEE